MIDNHSLQINNLSFSWESQPPILEIPNLNLAAGQSLFVQGSSGSGKSTLLNIISGVLDIQKGEVRLLDRNFSALANNQRDQFRADHIGYIFQQFNLLPYLTVLENVLLPCYVSAKRRQNLPLKSTQLQELACDWLNRLNVPVALNNEKITRLSIGQQQRVAAARAMIGSPEVIIADEPTSALDQDNVDNFMEVLTSQCKNINSSLIFVSHDQRLERYFNQSIHLSKPNNGAE